MQSIDVISPFLPTDDTVRNPAHPYGLSVVTDADLVRLCRSRDRDARNALEELTRRFQAPLFRFLLRLTGSQEDAEEEVLEVFVRVWQHSGGFRHQASVSTWLYRIAANIARDRHARLRARPQTESWDTDGLAQHAAGNVETEALKKLDNQERAVLLQRALATLSADDRLVLVLYYLEERDYSEMQAITGWLYPVLKTRLVRARARLRARLKEWEFEEAV